MSDEIDPADWPDKLRPIVKQMNALLELEPGWNSYDAKPIQREACTRGLEMLQARDDVPLPQVVPRPPGGIQLEWLGPDGDFCVEFDCTTRMCKIGVTLDIEEWRSEVSLVPLETMLVWIGGASRPAVEVRKD